VVEADLAVSRPGLSGPDVDRALPAEQTRQSLTGRAKTWVARRVGADGDSVASVARTLGVGWWSAMRAVIEVGRPLVEDPARLDGVSGLGVDEHAWQRGNPVRHTQYATGVVGFRPGQPARLLEVVPGRSGCSRSCPAAPAAYTPTGSPPDHPPGATRSASPPWTHSAATSTRYAPPRC